MITPEQRVFYAVINQAIFDACDHPITRPGMLPEMTTDARSAINFLFTSDLDAYAKWLEIDAGQIRNRLKILMYSKDSLKPFFQPKKGEVVALNETKCRNMRGNYETWLRNPYVPIPDYKDSEKDLLNVNIVKA